jgi:hypothetical protein
METTFVLERGAKQLWWFINRTQLNHRSSRKETWVPIRKLHFGNTVKTPEFDPLENDLTF